MRKSHKDQDYIVPMHFERYYSGRCEVRSKANVYAWLIMIMLIVLAIINKYLLNVNSAMINIVFPISYMGAIAGRMMCLQLEKVTDGRHLLYESSTIVDAVIKKGREDTFLMTIALYTGILELVLQRDWMYAVMVLVLLAGNVNMLLFTGDYEAKNKKRYVITLVVSSVLTIIIGLMLRFIGIKSIVPGVVTIGLVIAFAIIATIRTRVLLKKTFSDTEKEMS